MILENSILRRGKKTPPREEVVLNYIDLPPGSGFADTEGLSDFFNHFGGLESFREQLLYEKEFINEWGGEG